MRFRAPGNRTPLKIMRKVFVILIISFLFSVKVYAGKEDMISALKGIPGVADADWAQKISLWVVMSNPNAGHNFDQMGSMICNGGVSNFGVKKGYTITFWNAYTKKPIKKFQCY